MSAAGPAELDLLRRASPQTNTDPRPPSSQVSASQFFVFVLFTYVSNLAMLAIFRSLASANRHEPNATLAAGILVLIIAIYVGYSIPRPSMKVWFRWLSYAQPVSFGFESLIANECMWLPRRCCSIC